MTRTETREARYRQAEARLWRTYGIQPREHRVRLGTTGTQVRVLEVGEGEPTLFIHGGPNAGSTWAPLVPHLDRLRCLIVDRPGTGLSDPYPMTPVALPAFGASFVGDVLDGLRLERAHVVASSFGGHLALRSAAATPHRFGRMVQMACPALSPGEQEPPFMRLLGIGWLRKLIGRLPPNARANRSILRQIGHGKSLDAGRLPAGFEDYYLALQRHTDTMRNDGELIATILPAREWLTLDDRLLASVEVPTLFLWGADDTFGGEAVARHIVAVMPDAQLRMIPDAGHLPWFDEQPRIAAATAGFLVGTADAQPAAQLETDR